VRDILGIMVDVNLLEEAGEETLEIVVEPYPYPVSYKGEYHYRSGSTKQELKGAALDRFLLRKQGKHWDGVPVPNVGPADLDSKTISGFRSRALKSQRLSTAIANEPDAGLLDKLHLVEGAYLKRAAVLLFHPDPERFVTGAFVKIGFFRNNVDLLFQDEVHGDLFTQVDKTLDLLQTKYLTAGISYQGVQRVETYPVPEAALREAVLNAIVHKDYAGAIPIQISVYPDKLMIWNPGQLPPDWTVERLMGKHSSQPFNPDMANVFFRAGMIEAWGRGIERMLEACRSANVPKPSLHCESSGLWVEFGFPKNREKTRVETRVKTRGETRVKTREKTREKILRLIVDNPKISMEDMATSLGITRKGVEWQVKRLKDEGALRRVGSAKGGHWEVLK